MIIHMDQHFGDGDYWCMRFISQGFEFTEEDLVAVRCAVELPTSTYNRKHPGGRERMQRQLDQYDRLGGSPSHSWHGGWDRGLHGKKRIAVSCKGGQRPGPTAYAYHVLKERYPNACFTMSDRFLRESLTKQGLVIVPPKGIPAG